MINTAITTGNLLALAATVSALCVITVRSPVSAVLWLIAVFVTTAAYLVNSGLAFIGLSYIIVYVGAIAVLFLFVVMMLNVAALQAVQTANTELTRPVDSLEELEPTSQVDPMTVPVASSTSSPSVVVAEYVTKKQPGSGTGHNAMDSIPVAILLAALFYYGVSHYAPSIELALPVSVLDWLNSPFMSTDTLTDIGMPTLGQANGLLVFETLNPMTGYTLMTQVQTLGMSLYTEGSLWLLLTSVLLLLAMLAPIALCIEAVAKTNDHALIP